MIAPMRSAQQGCSVEAILIRGASEPAGQLGRGLHGWRVEPPEEKALPVQSPSHLHRPRLWYCPRVAPRVTARGVLPFGTVMPTVPTYA